MSGRLRLLPARAIRGQVSVPGDKSISHRALLLAAIADGSSRITGRALAGDQASMVGCLGALGVAIEDSAGGTLVSGVGLQGLRNPVGLLDCGNSGATMRFLTGLVAGVDGTHAVLVGDASLSRRPMERVADPLRRMGAAVRTSGGGLPPVEVDGKKLHGAEHQLRVASAQVKTAILLAGLNASGETRIAGPGTGRDHTERLLRHLGVDIETGDPILLRPPASIPGFELAVPGDLSSAAFWLVLAAVHRDAELTVVGVGANPTRLGFVEVLRRMGAEIEVSDRRDLDGEPTATLTARTSALRATDIQPAEVPTLVDEIPVLAVAAACAKGVSRFRGLGELRYKEVDRLEVMAAELSRLGALIAVEGDDLVITGRESLDGARVDSRGDHRVAMSMGVAAMVARGETELGDAEAAAVSYPGFFQVLAELGAITPG